MDDSSRKIVLFIGTVTVAALLLMAARYIAESQTQPAPATVEETKVAPVTPATQVADETDPEQSADEQALPEEEGFPPMGEPTVNIEQGGSSSNYAPVESNPQPAPEQMPQPSAAPYEANN